MWQSVRRGLQLAILLLLAWGLCGCLTTFSIGTAARPADAYRPSGIRGDNLDSDIPTPQLFNFGFGRPELEVYE